MVWRETLAEAAQAIAEAYEKDQDVAALDVIAALAPLASESPDVQAGVVLAPRPQPDPDALVKAFEPDLAPHCNICGDVRRIIVDMEGDGVVRDCPACAKPRPCATCGRAVVNGQCTSCGDDTQEPWTTAEVLACGCDPHIEHCAQCDARRADNTAAKPRCSACGGSGVRR